MAGDSAGVWKWLRRASLVIGGVAAALAIVAYLGSMFGFLPARDAPPGDSAAVQSNAPAATPCEELLRRGYRCAADDLVNALANPDADTIRLFVEAGYDGYSMLPNFNVFGAVHESNPSGFEALVSAMVAHGAFERYSQRQCRAEETIPLVLAASYDFFPQHQRCAVLREDQCLADNLAMIEEISAAQTAAYRGEYERYGTLDACVATYTTNRSYHNQYRAFFQLDFNPEVCLYADDRRACAVNTCQSEILPQYRRKYPTLDAFVENSWLTEDDDVRDEWYRNARRVRALMQSCNVSAH